MLRGGATKKGIYNIFGFDSTGLGRTTVRYEQLVYARHHRHQREEAAALSRSRRRLGALATASVSQLGFQWKGTQIAAKKCQIGRRHRR